MCLSGFRAGGTHPLTFAVGVKRLAREAFDQVSEAVSRVDPFFIIGAWYKRFAREVWTFDGE